MIFSLFCVIISKQIVLPENEGGFRVLSPERRFMMKIYEYKDRKNLSGRKIQFARKRLGLSQENLAVRLQTEGVSLERDSLSRIETGSRFVADYELKAFAKVLEVPVDWLLDENESFNSKI